MIHRKEQIDLDCKPWVCLHVERTNKRGNRQSSRWFCLWENGVEIGNIFISWRRFR